ncbi:hypothetical protein [Oscillibacter sp.]|uniref:hypothetical protein n=1 Tax=Oscillibacter sp. TaxID=1945593 RepID=UPI0028A619D4|nr:hypothetical protein [Oscillibacter sp.]
MAALMAQDIPVFCAIPIMLMYKSALKIALFTEVPVKTVGNYFENRLYLWTFPCIKMLGHKVWRMNIGIKTHPLCRCGGV